MKTAWSDISTIIVEAGTGDTRSPTLVGVWGTSRWSDPNSGVWSGIEPLWRDVTCEGQRVTIRRGVDYSTQRFPTSDCQLRADNLSGWASQMPAGELGLRPGRQLRVSGGPTDRALEPLWRGFVDDVSPRYRATTRPQVVIDAVDALSQLAAVDGLEVAPVGAGELSGARITRLLDLIGWPDQWRNIAAGQVAMQATNLARNLADEAGVTADSEGGALFAGRDGLLIFKDRDWWRTASPTPIATLGPDTIPGAYCPVGWDVTYGMADIVSVVSLSNAGGTVRQYVDPTAFGLFGASTYRRYDLICQDEGQLDLLAGRILAVRATSGPRVRGATLSLLATPEAAAFIAGLDFGQRVRAVHHLDDGSLWDQVMIVTNVQHDIDPDDWVVNIGLESAAPYAPRKPWGVARWGIDLWSVAA